MKWGWFSIPFLLLTASSPPPQRVPRHCPDNASTSWLYVMLAETRHSANNGIPLLFSSVRCPRSDHDGAYEWDCRAQGNCAPNIWRRHL